jgi:diaminopimelate epimerase
LCCGRVLPASELSPPQNETVFTPGVLKTPGGNLTVEFDKIDEQHFENIWLCGPAEFVFKAEIDIAGQGYLNI